MGAEAAVAKVLTPMPSVYSTARHRVLMTTDTVSDVWPYAIELSKALIARGHAVALAAMGGMPSREQQREVAAVPGLALHASAYKLAWMDEPWEDMRAAGKWLLNLARDLRPTIVHLNGFGHADLSWPAPVITVAHSCVLAWWRAVHGAPPPPAWLRYRQCRSVVARIGSARRADLRDLAQLGAALWNARRHARHRARPQRKRRAKCSEGTLDFFFSARGRRRQQRPGAREHRREIVLAGVPRRRHLTPQFEFRRQRHRQCAHARPARQCAVAPLACAHVDLFRAIAV